MSPFTSSFLSPAKSKTLKSLAALLLPVLSQVLPGQSVLAQPPEPRKVVPAVAIAPEVDPGSIVGDFVNALTTNFNVEVAAFMVKGGATGEALKPVAGELEKERTGWTTRLMNVSVQAEGNTARAKVRLNLGHRLFGKIIHEERLDLEKVKGTWKIVPLSTNEFYKARRDSFDSDILATYATYLARPQEVHEVGAYACLSNLKQLGLGVMQFVQDYDEAYKLKAANYRQAIMPYVRSEELFYCPDDKEGVKNNRPSYSFNVRFENLSLARIAEPAQTVLLYEGKDEQLDFRHNNRAAVCFADGHCKLITPEEAKTLRWRP